MTVVDARNVEVQDLGHNFFVTKDHLGQSRGKTVTELLLELNSEVAGEYVQKDPAEIIANSPEFFDQFTLVIATQLDGESVQRLADVCWEAELPLVVVRVHGLIGYSRIVVPEHTVIESHPEQIVDLRFDCPFETLRQFADSFDLESLDSHSYGHVPYIVILLKCVEHWKGLHGGALPSNGTERSDFKDLIRSTQRPDLLENQNFEEALSAAYRAWTPTTIPASINAIINDDRASKLSSKTPNFWFIAKAVQEFVANEGQGYLPLPGNVPDMHADSDSYIKLQTIFRAKAREDAATVSRRVQALLATVGEPSDRVPQDEIDRFCKNAGYLKVIRYRSLKEEYHPSSAKSKEIGNWLESDPADNIGWYIMLRVYEDCYARNKLYPGLSSEHLENDAAALRKAYENFMTERGLNASLVPDEHIEEFTRAGGSELHVLAALQGGLVAQEVIKLLTRQYVPLDNTVIFNGMKSIASVYSL
ncbi:NEDD8-activating enzyme E1 regulatory subunit [Thoreauomyces humboldtii]|nr:NEDD8-activating enzyme E1 regulatory subunit [Thoreauomyces humboldtii]